MLSEASPRAPSPGSVVGGRALVLGREVQPPPPSEEPGAGRVGPSLRLPGLRWSHEILTQVVGETRPAAPRSLTSTVPKQRMPLWAVLSGQAPRQRTAGDRNLGARRAPVRTLSAVWSWDHGLGLWKLLLKLLTTWFPTGAGLGTPASRVLEEDQTDPVCSVLTCLLLSQRTEVTECFCVVLGASKERWLTVERWPSLSLHLLSFFPTG